MLTKKEHVYRVVKSFGGSFLFFRDDQKKFLSLACKCLRGTSYKNDGNFSDTKTLTEISPGRFDQNLAFGIMSLPVFPDPLLISAPTTQ